MPPKHPNLFLVGAGKSGTTSLFSYLSAHTDVFPSRIKEPHYYSLAVDRSEGPWDALPHVRELPEYLELFGAAGGEQYRMDGSASYLFYPAVPELIAAEVRDARIIVLLRDPVARAFSDYRHQRRLGREPLSFEDAIERERAGGRGYLAQSAYADQVTRYLDVFGDERVLIRAFETFFAQVDRSVAEVCGWLGIDRDQELTAGPPLNVGESRAPVSAEVYRAARGLARWLPAPLVRLGKRALTREVRLDRDTQRALTDHFRPDVARLATIADLDLSAWSCAS